MANFECSAVRLLPERPNHAGFSIASEESESIGHGYRTRNGRQYLPLRHIPAHPRRYQDGCRRLPERRPAVKLVENVSRRRFLGGLFSAGAFVIVSQVLPESAFAQDPNVRTRAQSAPLNPSVYLGVEPDGSVFIVTHRSEMGTGIRTSLPLVAADELEADWNRCRIEQGLGDAKYGDQNTDGSRSVRDFYEAFRRAGASARTMLVSAAAAQWKVPGSECVAQNHEIVHKPSGRKLGYGTLVPAAAKLPVPAPEVLKFKSKAEWKFVGHERSIYDLSDITTGKAPFGLDVYRDGMVYASVEHPPVVGGTIRSVDDKEADRKRGVQRTLTIDPPKPPLVFQSLGGVAVIRSEER